MPITELTAEALTNLIAGSDTTSNSSCAIIFFIVRNPGYVGFARSLFGLADLFLVHRVHKKLIAELDEVLTPRGIDGVVEYEDVSLLSTLPFLLALSFALLRFLSSC